MTQCNGSVQLDSDGNVADPARPAPPNATSTNNGTRASLPQQADGRYQAGDDSFQPAQPGRHDVTADRPIGDLLDTATTASGAPIPRHEVNAMSLIRLPNGMQISVGSALRIGVIRHTPAGFVDPAAATANAGATESRGPKAPAPANINAGHTEGDERRRQQSQQPDADSDADADANADPAPLPIPEAVKAVVESAAQHPEASKALLDSFLTDGEPSANAIADMAQRLGADPSNVMADFESVRAALSTQAADTVAKLGVDPQAVFDWASSQPPDSDVAKALRKAVNRHATHGEAHHYGRVASLYFAEQVRHHPAAAMACDILQGSGLEILRESSTGPVLVRLQNRMVVPLADALAEGVLSLR